MVSSGAVGIWSVRRLLKTLKEHRTLTEKGIPLNLLRQRRRGKRRQIRREGKSCTGSEAARARAAADKGVFRLLMKRFERAFRLKGSLFFRGIATTIHWQSLLVETWNISYVIGHKTRSQKSGRPIGRSLFYLVFGSVIRKSAGLFNLL